MRFSLLWFSVTVVACGPSTPRELWQPAGPGETVMYTLSYLGVVVGRGDVSVTAAGSNRWKIATRGSLSIAQVYSARAEVNDDWSPSRGSLSSEQLLVENGRQRRETVTFDETTPVVHVRKAPEGGEETALEVTMSPQANNVATTAFAALRVSPLQPKEQREINLFTGKEVKPLVATHVGKRWLNTAFGEVAVDQLRIEGQLSESAALREPMQLFISDDATRLPMRLEAKIGLGTLSLDAVDYRFGELRDEASK